MSLEMKQVTLEEWKINHELEKANIVSYDHLASEFVREMNQHREEQSKVFFSHFSLIL